MTEIIPCRKYMFAMSFYTCTIWPRQYSGRPKDGPRIPYSTMSAEIQLSWTVRKFKTILAINLTHHLQTICRNTG